MRVSRPALALGAMAMISLCVWAGASGAQASRSPVDLEQHQFSSIKGKKVEDQDGVRLGKVRDFILDMRASRTRYVLIDAGGFLGVRSRMKVIPAYALSSGSAKRDTVSLYASKSAWKRTVVFTKSDLAQMNQPDRARQISRPYPRPVETAKGSETRGAVAPAGDHGPTRAAEGELKLASDLLGRKILDRQQHEIGELTDLLVDFSGEKPTLAIISAPGSREHGQRFAIPLRTLTLIPEDRLMLNANRAVFGQAKPFNEKGWQTAADSAPIFRYEEGTAEHLPTYDLTPESNPTTQGAPNADRLLTQRVRQSLENDPTLPAAALKELKIITIKGKVTLRGRVSSQQEKSQIERTARQVAGSRNVNNQLIIVQNH